MILFYLIAFAIYIWAVVVFFTIAAIPVAAVVTLGFGGALVVTYVRTIADTMIGHPARFPAPIQYPPRARTPDGPEPAYTQYLFGQAFRDLRHVLVTTTRQCRSTFLRFARWTNRSFLGTGGRRARMTWPLGIVIWVGIPLGIVVGTAVAALFAAVHVLVVMLMLVIGWTAIYLLRAADTVRLRLRGIRMMCPHCYSRIVYPSYRCAQCSTIHRDVRPGRYGVAQRVCACGARLRTLILLGSHRQAAVCPHCNRMLADHTGSSSEVVLPVLGAAAAGKTRLMLSMIAALADVSDRDGGSLSFADQETRRRYETLRPALNPGDRTRATLRGLPRAYSVYVQPRRGPRRLTHIFDAAGEVYNQSEDIQELQYLRTARLFLFVVDPLSVEGFWRSLGPADQARLAPERAVSRPPEFVFQQALQNIEQMGVVPNRARLAVVVSKADLIRQTAGDPSVAGSTDDVARWVEHTLGLDNLVRLMRLQFHEVRFFLTAAIVDAAGAVDPSVLELTRWTLGVGGTQQVEQLEGQPS